MTFISDSTEIEFCGKDMEEAYQMGRADAIDEFVKYANTMPTVENESGEIRPMWLEEMAEQLKEQKNEY